MGAFFRSDSLRRLIARTLFALALLGILTRLPVAASGGRVRDPYAFGCDAKTFSLQDFGDPNAFVGSPDGRKRIALAEDGALVVILGSKRLRKIWLNDLSANLEVGWARDSEQFFVSWSDGGAIGGYHVRAFRIANDARVMELAAPKNAYAEFRKRHYCQARGDNIFMLGWTPDSRQLFLVAEVYPTSDCEEMGFFRGYLMDAATGRVVKVFGEKETEAIKKKSRAAGSVQLPGEPSTSNQ